MKNEIKLPVAELKHALPGFNKIINKSNCLPALNHLRIQRDPEGEILIHTTNLDDFATVRLSEPQPGQPTDLLVPFETLVKFTRASSPKDALRLLPGEGGAVLVYPLGNTFAEQKLDTLLPEEWPVFPTFTASPITLDDDFKGVLEAAMDCSSVDESRKVLNGACLDVTDSKAHYVVATDGRHLFSANSFSFDLEQSLIIPNRKFLGWSGFVQDGAWKLTVKQPEKEKEPGWLRIESEKWRFITRQIEGTYPNWRLVAPDPASEKTTVHLEDGAVEFLLSVIPKLPGTERDQGVGLVVQGDGQFLIRSRAQGHEDYTVIPVPNVHITGHPTTVHINRIYLAKALKLGMTKLDLRGPESPLILYSGNQRLIVAPLRVEGGPPEPKPASPPAQTIQPIQSSQPAEPATEETMNPVNRVKPAIHANGQSTPEGTEQRVSSLLQAAEKLDEIKTVLKGVVSDLSDALKVITQAQKEKRATEREIEAIRDSLRSLQKVKI
jgi:DNA polymerase III sliding clamp (beta) subunit (PCNA family)